MLGKCNGGKYSTDILNYKDSVLPEWYGMSTGEHLPASDKALCLCLLGQGVQVGTLKNEALHSPLKCS
jgi:hypothetical protein